MSNPNLTRMQAVVSPAGEHNPYLTTKRLTLFNEDGEVLTVSKLVEAQADSTATTVADLVADHNALLAKLRAAGVMANS